MACHQNIINVSSIYLHLTFKMIERENKKFHTYFFLIIFVKNMSVFENKFQTSSTFCRSSQETPKHRDFGKKCRPR